MVLCTVALCMWAALGCAAPGDTAPLLLQDFQRLCRPVSLGLLAGGLGGAGIAHRWDDDLEGRVTDNAAFEELLDLANACGASRTNLTASLGVWALARATGHPGLQAAASEVARSLVLAGTMVVPLKRLVGRRRPDGSDRRSFPSGHTASAFAMSTALARRYGAYSGVPLYAFAALVPIARIRYQRHYFSDVVAGAVLGTAAGSAVTRQQEGRLTWVPTCREGEWGVEWRWVF